MCRWPSGAIESNDVISLQSRGKLPRQSMSETVSATRTQLASAQLNQFRTQERVHLPVRWVKDYSCILIDGKEVEPVLRNPFASTDTAVSFTSPMIVKVNPLGIQRCGLYSVEAQPGKLIRPLKVMCMTHLAA